MTVKEINISKINSLSNANRFLIPSEVIKKLYYKGNFDLNFNKCLAVVGSRKVTPYGEEITQKLVSDVASKGITIVSGFMYGVDCTAHKAALDVGGKTIAVLPYGINREPPSFYKPLYNSILRNGGLIISEYGNNEPAQKWTFPKRNRIVAGLSKTTLVIEASKNSGSLITANYALKMKRKVFAVPGPLISENSIGTANLIKGEGCIVTSSKDILDFFD